MRAADAIADRVHLHLAGRFLDRVHGGEGAELHVVVEAHAGMRGVGIDP